MAISVLDDDCLLRVMRAADVSSVFCMHAVCLGWERVEKIYAYHLRSKTEVTLLRMLRVESWL